MDWTSAADIAAAVSRGQSALSVVEGALSRIAAKDKLLNSFTAVLAERAFAGFSPGNTEVEILRLRDEARATDGAQAYALLGLAYQQRARETADTRDYIRSERALRAALHRDRANVYALGGLGSLALSRHRFGEALTLGRRAQRLAPATARTYGVIGDALVLTMMRFSDELADLDEFSFPSTEGLRKPELTMARQLVDNLSAEWEPEKYTDEYVENLMRLIDAKLKGRKPKLETRKTRQPADVVDLMARLKASLEARPKGETARRTQASKRKGSSRRTSRRVA